MGDVGFADAYFAPSLSGTWVVDVVDRTTGSLLLSLTSTSDPVGVTGGKLDWSIFTPIRDSGSLELALPASVARSIRWDRVRVRVRWDMTHPEHAQHPLGVYLATSSETTYAGDWARVPLTLHGLTTLLARVRTTSTLTMAAGTLITDRVTQLIIDAGIRRYAVTPSLAVLSGARSWEPGTTYLSVVNDVLAAAGYFAVYTDPLGVVRADPYVTPSGRAIRHVFADDHQGLYLPGWKLALDDWDTPNRVTVIQRVSGDTAPLVAVVTDDDPDSPYRYAERGGWVDAERIEIDAPDLATLTAAGRRRLTEAQSSVQTIDYTYGYLPLVEHDAVRFTNTAAGLSADYTLAKRSISLDRPVPLVDAQIRRTLR